MKISTLCFLIAVVVLAVPAASVEPGLTIYNQDFAVVRENIRLKLDKGINQVSFTDTTAHLEPDSVMLRDPQGKRALRILEQNFRADPISQGLLLSLYEGKTIDCLIHTGEEQKIVPVKIIRSGYVYHPQGLRRYGQQYYQRQMAYVSSPGTGEIIVEFEGKIRFGLPGQPLFPNLADDTILKPTLNWVLETDATGPVDAEIGYVTGGMSWEASYNLVGAEKSDKLDIVGWVTMDNQSGRTFENARIKLMAGDVSKLQEQNTGGYGGYAMAEFASRSAPPVSEKTFDEYHLYTLERRTTLHDRETKQVEFIRAENVKSERFYVYDGARIDRNQYRGWDTSQRMQNREYGTPFGTDVWVMRELENTKANGLGMPLPAGRTRFYVRDDDGQLEFTGENIIDHTPRNETLRIYTGNAFDLVGDRTQTDFKCEYSAHWTDESFKITLRNRKEEDAEIRVIEHLRRGRNWTLRDESDPYIKMEAQLIEFRVQLEPDEEKTITYTVHYTW